MDSGTGAASDSAAESCAGRAALLSSMNSGTGAASDSAAESSGDDASSSASESPRAARCGRAELAACLGPVRVNGRRRFTPPGSHWRRVYGPSPSLSPHIGTRSSRLDDSRRKPGCSGSPARRSRTRPIRLAGRLRHGLGFSRILPLERLWDGIAMRRFRLSHATTLR
jgi:hypothetical protein